jgi:hypothetical protein
MWRRNAVVVALLVVHEVAGTSPGQERPAGSLLSTSRWVHFELVLGQITTVAITCGQCRSPEDGGSASDVQEALSICGEGTSRSVTYERNDPQQSLKLEAANGTRIIISREPRNDSSLEPVRFVQTSRGNVSLVIGRPPSQRQRQAASLWHLVLAEPDACRQYLIPLLQVLRPDWQLLESAEQIEANLCRARASPAIPRDRIVQLVAQLDNPNFQSRQSADREIRSFGVLVLPYLAGLETSRLSCEQRTRVRRIRDDLAALTPDNSERVATWLLHDEQLWRQWLAHPDPSRREAAARGLAGMFPGDRSFDRATDETYGHPEIARLRNDTGHLAR